MILLDEDGVTVQNRNLGRTEEQGQWQTSATWDLNQRELIFFAPWSSCRPFSFLFSFVLRWFLCIVLPVLELCCRSCWPQIQKSSTTWVLRLKACTSTSDHFLCFLWYRVSLNEVHCSSACSVARVGLELTILSCPPEKMNCQAPAPVLERAVLLRDYTIKFLCVHKHTHTHACTLYQEQLLSYNGRYFNPHLILSYYDF